MITDFIAIEIDLSPIQGHLIQAIASELSKHGEPLRWAIVSVNQQTNQASIEAVVTNDC
jgi:hypothetical protein